MLPEIYTCGALCEERWLSEMSHRNPGPPIATLVFRGGACHVPRVGFFHSAISRSSPAHARSSVLLRNKMRRAKHFLPWYAFVFMPPQLRKFEPRAALYRMKSYFPHLRLPAPLARPSMHVPRSHHAARFRFSNSLLSCLYRGMRALEFSRAQRTPPRREFQGRASR